nr:SpoIIE family protein phosphatase [Motilibacter aurantiacus]
MLVQEAPLGFAFYDAELRYRGINRVLAAVNGLPVEEHLGHRPAEILGDLGVAVEDMLRRVMETGAPVHDDDFVGTGPDGSVTHWQSQWFPARGEDGRIRGVAVFVADVTQRRTTEDALLAAYQRAERLLTVTTRLATALTLAEVMAVVTDEARSLGALVAGLSLLDGDEVVFRPDSGVVPGPDARPDGVRVPLDSRVPTAVAITTGRPVYAASPEELVTLGTDPEWISRQVGASKERSWAAVPLLTARGTLGALRVAFAEPRTLASEERVFLEAVGTQCAVAVERALLYENEHRTAEALQASLLPDRLPQVAGAQLAGRYLPASRTGTRGWEATAVGGDWYDAFALPDGRLAVTLGDVMGKGVNAAAGMGRVRAALRALAFTDPSPSAVLSGLDRVFSATEGLEQIVTLVYGVLDPATRTLVATAAGHPPVVLVPASGPARLLPVVELATPLGVPEPRSERVLELSAGDTILAFSDGLVETREAGIGAGLDALAQSLGGCGGLELEALLDRAVAAGASAGQRWDDVTLLALRV